MKKQPLRMCISCREHKPKTELMRIVKTNENTYEIDISGKLNGRGAYVCKNKECFNKVLKNRLINRAFKTNINEEVYKKLQENFKNII